MAKDLKTIKILQEAVEDLNVVASFTKEKQYQVVGRLAKVERDKCVKKLTKYQPNKK